MIRIVYFLFLLGIGSSCTDEQKEANMLANDIRLYKGSPVWELAKAVEEEKGERIIELVTQDPELLDYQEERFGQTLLEWAVYTDRYAASKALVESGADPNVQSFNGTSAFIHASEKKKLLTI
ncbi:MAG: hypothetical protein CL840_21890 [Crocinitomicaceae bacterium]|nr:hypothetical protein [Crocinitomicaceae bacterium]|tara:strand:+ start:1294 stop:1662 length:369 start_codon:yes stop_codon:yes gene_type:complete